MRYVLRTSSHTAIKSKISQFYKTLDAVMEATSGFPISRQNLVGFQREDAQIAVLIADWTSAEEKDKFEPGKDNRNSKSCIFRPTR